MEKAGFIVSSGWLVHLVLRDSKFQISWKGKSLRGYSGYGSLTNATHLPNNHATAGTRFISAMTQPQPIGLFHPRMIAAVFGAFLSYKP